MTSNNEQEYFARQEIEKKKKFVEQKRAEMAAEEALKLKELHYFHCPKCGEEIHSVVFKGVTIEKCYNCGVTVLDDGELEKLAGEEGSVVSSIISLFK